MIGQVVGTYKIVSELGEGGVGTVYKGVDTMLDREVAIKVLRPELVSNESIVERFRSEAVTLAKLNHPNIATLFSLFRQGDELFMILEFVEGETVEDILQKSGAISTEDALPIFCQALNGLNYAHKLNIIHRDIKPSNMILTNDNVLKILDFGIARLLGSSRMTKVGNIIGTLEYMSPEQIRGEETDARSDIYGLGIMLYEILTGRLPFESENEFVLMKAHTEETPALPRSLNPNISIEIESAIVKAIAKNPNDRFQNADEFLQTLLELGFSAGENPAFGFESVYQAKTSASHKKAKQYNSKDFPKDVATEKETIPEKPTEMETVEIEQLQDLETIAITTEDINQTKEAEKETVIETNEFLPPKIEEKETNESPVPATAKETAIPMPTATEPFVAETNEFIPETNEIKETRLGSMKNVQTPKAEVKATRLGAVSAPVASNTTPTFLQAEADQKPFPNVLLEKLNWMHYAGAGAVLFLLFSIIAIAAVTPFLLGGSGGEKPVVTNSKTVKDDENKNPDSDTPKGNDSQIASEPALEPTPLGDSNLENTEEVSQPTPVEVAKDKKPTKKKKPSETKKPDSKTPKDNRGKKPGGKPVRNGGGTKRGGNNGTKHPPGLVESLTPKKPKPRNTPTMTDN